MDPLSDFLSLLKPSCYTFGGFDVGGDISVKFPHYEQEEGKAGIKCYVMVSGQGWLSVEGVPSPFQLTAGDCFLLPHGLSFQLATDLTLAPLEAFTQRSALQTNGGIVSINGGGDCFIIGGHFILSGRHTQMLLGLLPPVVHIKKESDKAAMHWSLDRMLQELRHSEPGGHLVIQNLATLILIQALRLHLAEGSRDRIGWLYALTDRQMGLAIKAMHGNPGHRWTLQELAEQVGMSRSVFAQRFRATVGESVMSYLTRWRMLLSADRLTNFDDPLSIIAPSVGYESESAFCTAFKRVMGCSPRQYVHRHKSKRDFMSDYQMTESSLPRTSSVSNKKDPTI
jgi:AraC-like DNA-binding protein